MPSSTCVPFKVPFACPLPRSCPVCDQPATRTIQIRAFEGIPLLITYHVKVPVNYCERHFRDLRRLSIRQWISMLLLPGFFILWAMADSYVRIRDDIAFGTVAGIAILSFILALNYGRQISRQRGVGIGTQGLTGTFLVKPTHEVWAKKARKNVERYHEHHTPTTDPGREQDPRRKKGL